MEAEAHPGAPLRVGLFIPCHVDQLWPEVGFAAWTLLERAGAAVAFPAAQTCCGQAHHSVGGHDDARALARRMARVFDGYDAVVAPSGSCAAMLRVHYPALLGGGPEAHAFAARCYELCDCLVRVPRAPAPTHPFPPRLGLHAGCHALRELRLGRPSEGGAHGEDPARALLEKLAGIELVTLARPDECCGFGGAFCVEEPAVSCRMGLDRLADHAAARAEVLTSSDPSCLLHLGALARRHGHALRVLHVAQILADASPL
jgi:L-lactate dehydrogenase complex protein LldE